MDEIVEALRKRRYADALERLLALWRTTRAPRIADLVERVSPHVSPPLPPTKEKRRQDHREWMAASKARDASKIVALLETLSVGTVTEVAERVDVVAAWPADPRVASALVRFVEAPPFPGEKAKAILWPKVLENIAELGDGRGAERLREASRKLSQKYGDTFAAWLSKEAETLAKRLELRKPDPVDVTAIEAALPRSRGEDDKEEGAALLAKVVANPRDDGARLVWADHLTEQGDIRGEFIVLQMEVAEHRATVKQARRAEEILDEHYKEWIADLEALLPLRAAAWSRFEKGFLVAVELGDRVAEDRVWEKAIGHPLLATVREVLIGPSADVRVARILAAMPVLETVCVSTDRALTFVSRAPSLTATTLSLELAPLTPAHATIIAESPAFGGIRALEIRFYASPEYEDEEGYVDEADTDHAAAARAFAGGPLATRVRSIEVHLDDVNDEALAAWLDPRHAPACEVKVISPHSVGTLRARDIVVDGPAALQVLERCRGAAVDSIKIGASGLRPSVRKKIEALAATLDIKEKVVN